MGSYTWSSPNHQPSPAAHAIIGAPFAFVSAGYMTYFGGHWLASIYGGVGTVLLAAAFQEWSDQRAHMAIVAHHIKEEFVYGIQMRASDSSSRMAAIAEMRNDPPIPEVWSGWDWKDFVGFAIGAQVGAVLAVIVL